MNRFLGSMARRLRLVWAWATAAWIAPVIAAVALGLVAIGWLVPWVWPEPAAIAVALVASVLVVGWAIVQPLPGHLVARAADRGLTTGDSFETALHFRTLDGPFGERIRTRAEHLAENADPAVAAPFPSHERRWGLAIGLAVLALVGGILANPQDDERAARAAAAEQIDALADGIEEQAAALADDPATAELAAELEALAEELRSTDDLLEAQEILEAKAEELEGRQPNDFASQRAAAEGLERSLADRPLAGAPSSSAAEQLAALAESLDALSEEEQAALAERLADLAATQAAGDPATAAALEQAAAALANGDVASARAALGEAALAQASAANAVAGQVANGQAAEGLRAAGEGLGSGEGSGEGAGQGQGSGEGAGEGQGEGQGQGAGQGSGQAGSGAQGQVGGATGGSGQGQGGQGTSGGGDQPRNDSNDGATIVDPASLIDGEDVNLGGSPNGQGSEVIGEGDGATGAGTTRVPVSDIISDYANRATTASGSGRFSPDQQELIGNYFDLLAG